MTHDKTGIELFSSTINPNRGAWLEYETDINDVYYVRIDKNRKIFITTFIRALGLGTDDEIREFFGNERESKPPSRETRRRIRAKRSWKSSSVCVPASP